MTTGGLAFSFVLLSLAATLMLYALIEKETSNPRTVDRRDAEREVQARSGRSSRADRDDSSAFVDDPDQNAATDRGAVDDDAERDHRDRSR